MAEIMKGMKKLCCSLLFAGSLAMAADTPLGKPLTLKETVSIDKLLASPKQFVDQTVQVKGKILAICEKMGCWMKLAGDSGEAVRIKVKDGEIVFPKEAIGRMATAEGKFVAIEGGGYQIKGAGAVVHE
jgi:hypothetical protein